MELLETVGKNEVERMRQIKVNIGTIANLRRLFGNHWDNRPALKSAIF